MAQDQQPTLQNQKTPTAQQHKQYIITKILVAFVALLHVFFLILEMFLWTTPFGRQISGFPEAFAQMTQVLAANQGLYNGFLAMGLIWSIFSKQFYFELQLFFLGCIVIAGIFGAATGSIAILGIQAAPALVVLHVVLLERFLLPFLKKRWALRREQRMAKIGDENSNMSLLSSTDTQGVEYQQYNVQQEAII
ncbi:predicted protein [Naegleria gruberi]|uniref:Predicted protein n=1 Tax=Naegleria gruberi TaxID=5762 RepID=D2W1R9_NAEGR|nr:uncharacterized protein NAEGRDRAFT_75353 [Naegleria gruberi]EFC36967.1 predicted protein [Naegleria gruberi]|eukprot:XP_002669711.1 predicted protein [Naegleria gruberi strain NEG-M]